MAKRIKPAGLILASVEEIDGALAEMALIDRSRTEITGRMNEEIDQVKKKAELEGIGISARYKQLSEAIKVFAVLNEERIFEVGKKSRELAFGIIGFRSSTDIVQMNKISAETTLDRLGTFKFTEAINTKVSILKAAMVSWTDEKLQSVGLRRRLKNDFYIEIKAETLTK